MKSSFGVSADETVEIAAVVVVLSCLDPTIPIPRREVSISENLLTLKLQK